MDSEPHIVIPIKKVTLHFNEVVYPRDPYLPKVSGSQVDVIFIAEGQLYFGYYHGNGHFYTYSSPRVFRGIDTTANQLMAKVTHWCYHTKDKIP